MNEILEIENYSKSYFFIECDRPDKYSIYVIIANYALFFFANPVQKSGDAYFNGSIDIVKGILDLAYKTSK